MKEMVDVPHTAVIYPDRRYRNQSIQSYLGRPKTVWGSLTVLSVQPETDTDFFTARGRKKVVRRSLPPTSVIDVREILSTKEDPAGAMISLLDRVRRNRRGQRPPLIIGDWIHETYGNIDIAMTVEESEREESNTFCCYRGEGFWSLGCGQIAQIFHLHRRVIFGSSVFEMTRP